jgi:hypothetical protein
MRQGHHESVAPKSLECIPGYVAGALGATVFGSRHLGLGEFDPSADIGPTMTKVVIFDGY